MNFQSITNFIPQPLTTKIVIKSDHFWYLWTAKDQNFALRPIFGHHHANWLPQRAFSQGGSAGPPSPPVQNRVNSGQCLANQITNLNVVFLLQAFFRLHVCLFFHKSVGPFVCHTLKFQTPAVVSQIQYGNFRSLSFCWKLPQQFATLPSQYGNVRSLSFWWKLPQTDCHINFIG